MSFFDLKAWDLEIPHYSRIPVHESHPYEWQVSPSGRLSTMAHVSSKDFLDLMSIYGKAEQVEERKDSRDTAIRCASDKVRPNEGRRHEEVLRRMRYLTSVAAIGGFLSGYNSGVISGALLPLTRVFRLSPFQEETIVSATILFAFCSSMAGGLVNHAVGRRRTILAAAAIFTCGGIFLFGAQNYSMLVIGEIILGIGIGLESLTNPMYISEVSKPDIRGMLVSAYAWMMCFGQFFAGLIDGGFGPLSGGWRFMFGTAIIPGALMFVGFLGLPESPAWLVSIGQEKEAAEILKNFRDTDQEALDECHAMRQSFCLGLQEEQSTSVWVLFRLPSLRRALIVGCSLMFLQQFCGANVVMYYSATVYRMSGFDEISSLWLSAFTASAQLLGLAFSLILVDKAGRRPLVLLSFSGVALCLFGLGISFYLNRVLSEPVNPSLSDPECLQQPALVWDGISRYCYDCSLMEGCGFCGGACIKGGANGPLVHTCPSNSNWQYNECVTPGYVSWLPVVFMVLYLIVFGIGAAGLPWTINSEIYPVKYRSLAVAISTGANWLCNLAISSTFLTISHPSVLTLPGSFFLYSIISIVGVVWLYWMLPETKGLSYDQIQKCFEYCSADRHRLRSENARLVFAHSAKLSYGSTFGENDDENYEQIEAVTTSPIS